MHGYRVSACRFAFGFRCTCNCRWNVIPPGWSVSVCSTTPKSDVGKANVDSFMRALTSKTKKNLVYHTNIYVAKVAVYGNDSLEGFPLVSVKGTIGRGR